MNERTTVLVTGSDGFVGRNLVPYLAQQGYKIVAASRTMPDLNNPDVTNIELPDLSRPFDWRPLLQRCDVIIHLAGISHKFALDDLYDRVNHQSVANLAHASVQVGIKHLILISSISAQSGSFSTYELTESDPPRPNHAYGQSKLAAERAVIGTGIPYTILRPVAIYGKGEKGNFATVHRIARLPVPLPFGGLTAKRSVLSIENLNSAIQTVLTNPHAREQTFIVSDPVPVTVAELIARYRARTGRPSWLLTVPERWLELAFRVTGQDATWERFGCSLVANPTKLLKIGWRPTPPTPF